MPQDTHEMGEPSLLLLSRKIRPANVGPNEQGFVDAFNAQMLSLIQSG
jgi:hypothetical protein